MKKDSISNQPILLKDISESLSQAIGGASQLTHAMQDPRWLVIRQSLELMQEGVMTLATFEAKKVTMVRK